MNETPPSLVQRTARAVGSLWFAAVLLVLLLFAMACATAYESRYGTERVGVTFYNAWWFITLLVLLGVNVLGALVARFPFTRRQIGFVITHAAIIVTLVGALVTKKYGIDGNVAIAEGQTVSSFGVSDDTLEISQRKTNTQAAIDLDDDLFSGFESINEPKVPPLQLGGVKAEVVRYLPDASFFNRVVNDSPRLHPAVQVSLSATGREDPVWLFENRARTIGAIEVTYRRATDESQLARLLEDAPDKSAPSKGTVAVTVAGTAYEIPIEDCTDQAATVGNTAYTVRVMRYMPHATVGADNKVVNASPNPVNPAVEVEVSGPDGREQRLAFARFPDFQSMHGGQKLEDVKIRFVSEEDIGSRAPVELISGPGNKLHVRFAPPGGEVVSREVAIGTPIETPWPSRKLVVHEQYDHARMTSGLEPVDPIRENRMPAMLVRIRSGADAQDVWVQKHRPRPINIDGKMYDLRFGDRPVPLGFQLTLDRFRIGYYPGTRRPRSFESHITVVNPNTGRTQSQVISMNHPADLGAYTLYQSSYKQDGGRSISYLSVARDPGQLVTFIGYIGMVVGMITVLCTRATERRPEQVGVQLGMPERASSKRTTASANNNGARSQTGSSNKAQEKGKPMASSKVGPRPAGKER